ncbi:MAG: hypothetical protein V7K40_33895 [Nostoc sp.]
MKQQFKRFLLKFSYTPMEAIALLVLGQFWNFNSVNQGCDRRR